MTLPLWQEFLSVVTAMSIVDGRVSAVEWVALKRLSLRDACVMAHAFYVNAIERQKQHLAPGIVEA